MAVPGCLSAGPKETTTAQPVPTFDATPVGASPAGSPEPTTTETTSAATKPSAELVLLYKEYRSKCDKGRYIREVTPQDFSLEMTGKVCRNPVIKCFGDTYKFLDATGKVIATGETCA
jgi:hypothetical protein